MSRLVAAPSQRFPGSDARGSSLSRQQPKCASWHHQPRRDTAPVDAQHNQPIEPSIFRLVEQLKGPVKAWLTGQAEFLEVRLDATNRRGKSIGVKVTSTQLSMSPAESPSA